MTDYAHNPSLREADSLYLSALFDAHWVAFLRDAHPDESYGDLPFIDTFAGLRRGLSFLKDNRMVAEYYWSMCKLARPHAWGQILRTNVRLVVPFLSRWKRWLHANADSLPPIWMCYIDLDLIAGFPLPDVRSFTGDPASWLSKDVEDKHTPEWWRRQIEEIWNESRDMATTRPITPITLEEFTVSRWMWTASGATRLSQLLLDGEAVNTKFGAAVSLSDDELLQIVRLAREGAEDMQLFVKQGEKGFKGRLICNIGLGGYIIQAYARYLVELDQGIRPRWITYHATLAQEAEVVRLLRMGSRAIPLDETAFDQHVSRAAWLGFIGALQSRWGDLDGIAAFIDYFDHVHWVWGEETGQWSTGMPSGTALTAMCNTLFNQVKQRAIRSPLHLALGDDVLLFNDTWSLQMVEEYYASFGGEVNPSKNWTSRQYAEFLRFVYSREGRFSYPARIYGTLMWVVDARSEGPLEDLYDLADIFSHFYNRAGLHMDERLVAADLSRAVSRRVAGFSAGVAKLWLHTPRAAQGYGLVPYGRYEFRFFSSHTGKKIYTNALFPLPPVMVKGPTKFRIRARVDSGAGFIVGQPLHLARVETMKQWEDRLNGRGLPVPIGKLADAVGVIPLPVVPFVGAAEMAKFAARWNFFAWPNMHGSAQQTVSRLVSGSLLLAGRVRSYMGAPGLTALV